MGSLRNKHKANLICGLVYMGIAIAVALYAQTIPVGTLNFDGVNSRTFPLICAAAVALLAGCLIWQGIHGMRKAPKPTTEELAAEKESRKKLIDVVLTIALVALNIWLLKPAGYLIVTPIFLFSLIMLVTPKDVRKPVKFAIISIVTAVATYLVFRYVFSVQLPMGILG